MSDKPKRIADRLLESSVMVLVSMIALTWAWQLLQPLLPVLVVTGMACGAVIAVRWWRSYW